MRIHTAIKTLALLVCLTLPALAGATGNISAADKYAWSETAGWVNFAPTGGGVTIYPDHLEGFAWAENIGWIKLGSHTGGGTYSYGNSTKDDWGVNLSNSALTGFGWSETAGWVSFNPAGGGVTLDTASGILDGYAWAENLGWLHFKGSSYTIGINKLPLTVILAGTGSGSVHSAPAGISCDAVGGCSGAFFQSWPVTLSAVPDWKSLFTGYTGDSSVAIFAMDTPKTVTATFDANNKAKLIPGDTLFASIQEAYASVPSGSLTIQAQEWSFLEGLLFGNGTAVTLTGGMDSGYNPTSGYSTVKSLTVGTGSAVIGNVTIR